MKRILTVFLLVINGLVFSQFNRTFLHANQSSYQRAFNSFAYHDDQGKVQLVSSPGVLDAAGAHITQQRLSAQGDLEAFDEFVYPVTGVSPSISYLLTAIEQGNERYYMFAAGDASVKLVWLKTNKTTGALISSHASSINYKRGYFEPKLVGNELVTYSVRSTGGLVRVALNTTTFSTPSEEMVNISDTTSMNLSRMLDGYKYGNLFVVNGVEKVVWGLGTSVKLYTRTSANNYTSITTGIPAWGSISSFLIDPQTIGITNGVEVEHYNAAGVMTNSGSFPWMPAFYASQVEYRNNQYHLFYKFDTSQRTGIFYTADQNFHRLDSVSTVQKIIYHLHKTANGLLMVGSDVKLGLSTGINGGTNAGYSVYCESYKNFPVVDKDEYGTLLGSANLKVLVGLGTKVIISPYGRSTKQYDDSLGAVLSLNDHFIGFIGSSDTVSNVRSLYVNQFDELPGPYTTNGLYDGILESKYNRPFRVSRQMILDHIDSVAFGSSSYIPVWQIRNWPAHGNPALGQAENLAPFADINSNGVYEPMLGEYPRIYGNDCVFSITHYRTNGDDSKALEFHSYVYTQACDSTETFDNVLMRKIRIYSRGAAIDSLFFGGNFDTGLWNRNYFAGTHVDLGMTYTYAGALYDPSFDYWSGYGDKLPAHGVMVLKGFRQPDDSVDNQIGILPGQSVNGYGFGDGITDNEYGGLSSVYIDPYGTGGDTWVPISTGEWSNALRGLSYSGDSMYYGGESAQYGTIPTRYMYTGNEDINHYATGGIDPGFSWYQNDTLGTGTPLYTFAGMDSRSIYSFGKTTLGNGESVELDYAYLIKRQQAPVAFGFDAAADLFTKAGAVRSAFLSNQGPCGINFDPVPVNLGLNENKPSEDAFVVYPNPTNGLVSIKGISENGAAIQVFDVSGKLLQVQTGFHSEQTLDLSGFEGNLFILRITDGSKSLQKRIVKY